MAHLVDVHILPAALFFSVTIPIMLRTLDACRLVRFANSIQIKIVFFGFTEEKEVLPSVRESVLDRRGHGVWFVPDDFVAQSPSSLDHGEHEAFRNSKLAFFPVSLLRRFLGYIGEVFR